MRAAAADVRRHVFHTNQKCRANVLAGGRARARDPVEYELKLQADPARYRDEAVSGSVLLRVVHYQGAPPPSTSPSSSPSTRNACSGA